MLSRRTNTSVRASSTEHVGGSGTPPPVCRRCKHSAADPYAGDGLVCRKMDVRDVVTGDLRRFSARNVRENRAYCAPEGRWYAAKDLRDELVFQVRHPRMTYVAFALVLLFLFGGGGSLPSPR